MSQSYDHSSQAEEAQDSSTQSIPDHPVPATSQLDDRHNSTSFDVERETHIPKQDRRLQLDFEDAEPRPDLGTVHHRLIRLLLPASDQRQCPCHSKEDLPSPSLNRPWRATILRGGPLSGIFAILLSLSSLVASLGILIGSNHASTESWTTEPSTYLDICTAIANLAIRYACIRGVIITWWCRALRGTTFEKLHHDWRSGTTLQGALMSGSRIGLLGAACIASTLVYVDGPLLQRASTTVLVPRDQTISLNISMAPEIPTGFTGFWWKTPSQLGSALPFDRSFNATFPTSSGPANNYIIPAERDNDITVEINKPWLEGAPYSGVVQGCPGKCRATITAPALTVTECKTYTTELNFTLPASAQTVNALGQAAAPLNHNAFLVGMALDVKEEAHESIALVVGHSDIDDCVGTLHWNRHDAMTIKSANPNIVAIANNTGVIYKDPNPHSPGYAVYRSTLATVVFLATFKWVSSIAYFNINGSVFSELVGSGVHMRYAKPSAPGSQCKAYADPRDNVIEDLNRLMVYTGMVAAAHSETVRSTWVMDDSLDFHATTIGHVEGQHNVFRAHFGWFAGAAAVEILCVLLILPTYYGWWILGRPVSFSPLEMAKAFESPLLLTCNSNSSGRDIAKEMRDLRLQYGAQTRSLVDGGGRITRLAFADPSSTSAPLQRARFGV